MKTILLSLCFLIGCSSIAPQPPLTTAKTEVEVVEWRDFRFEAESFFGERKNLSFREAKANHVYFEWASEAIQRVNSLFPRQAHLPKLKLKLLFQAEILDSKGTKRLTPISIIESYQEPKTNSIRLGMLELENDQESFQLTVAHEYAHLVFENASRNAGTTSSQEEYLSFWPKSVYEGVADLMMGMAMNSERTAGANNWSARYLREFKTLTAAKNAKDATPALADAAFKRMKLIPQFPIYEKWLATVNKYIASLGGTDPYAEGRWLAGSLKRKADSEEKRRKLAGLLWERARAGTKVSDIHAFHDELAREL